MWKLGEVQHSDSRYTYRRLVSRQVVAPISNGVIAISELTDGLSKCVVGTKRSTSKYHEPV